MILGTEMDVPTMESPTYNVRSLSFSRRQGMNLGPRGSPRN